MQICGDKLAF